MRSPVSKLTRPGRENARDTVDDATPAAFATSSMVGDRRIWFGPVSSTPHLPTRR
jgi:hypothetical protein